MIIAKSAYQIPDDARRGRSAAVHAGLVVGTEETA